MPLALALLLAGVGALALPAGSSWANRAFHSSQYSSAKSVWRWLAKQQIVDPWKAPFGEGTAALADAQYSQAIERLAAAYIAAPAVPKDVASLPTGTLVPRCDIQHNLALAYEGEADANVVNAQEQVTAAEAADDPSSNIASAQAFYELAIKGYEDARATRTRSGCADDATASQREVDQQAAAQAALDKLNNPADDATAQEPNQPDDQKTPDSQQPDDPDSTGDSNTHDNNPSDSPSSDPSDDPGQQQSPSASPTPSPSESLSAAEQQRRQELQDRQRQAQEQAEQSQQGSSGTDGTGKSW